MRRILARNTNKSDLGIISYWNLNSNSNDQVGSNDGTDTGIAYVSGGIIDDCAEFGGGTDSINIGSDSSLSFSSGFSYSFWVNYDTVNNATEYISKWDASVVDYEYRITKISNEIWFTLFSENFGGIYLRTKRPISAPTTGTWYNICVTWAGGTAFPKIYLNGVLGTQTTSSSGTFVEMSDTPQDCYFGSFRGISSVLSLVGKMDEIYLFNKELDATEVDFVYDEGIAGRTLI